MTERPDTTESDSRFDLQKMLQEVQAETAAHQEDAPVKTQSEIQKMFEGRKPREKDG